jgi:hypothetical protein
MCSNLSISSPSAWANWTTLARWASIPRPERPWSSALSEPAKFCAIAAHLIRNEQINLRSAGDFRNCQSAEEVLGKIRDEFGPEAAAALRRFNRAIERQGRDSRFCGNDCDVIDIVPDGTNR